VVLILVAALALAAVGALVLAVSASNEGVDQKQAVDEATEQINERLAKSISGLKRSDSGLTKGSESLESEVEELEARVTEFQQERKSA
jgi:septal ring factor EnvC (AmiA/AmiB activator)